MRKNRHFGSSEAVSPIIGGVLLVAITVIVLGLSVGIYDSFRDAQPPPGVTSSARGAFTQDGYMVSLAGPETVPLDEGGRLQVTIDGDIFFVPLTNVSAQLGGVDTWEVGAAVCIVGPSPCFFPTANVVGVRLDMPAKVVFELPPIPYVQAGPSFISQPDGGVQLMCNMPSTLRVVGVAIEAGGVPVPVTAGLSVNGFPPFAPLNGGNRVFGGEIFDLSTIPAGATLGVRGTADNTGIGGSFFSEYDSFSGDDNVLVLGNYDPAPAYAPFADQDALETFLAPYVNTDNQTMVVGPNETIILFEFVSDLSSPAADFQDLVMLFQFQSAMC